MRPVEWRKIMKQRLWFNKYFKRLLHEFETISCVLCMTDHNTVTRTGMKMMKTSIASFTWFYTIRQRTGRTCVEISKSCTSGSSISQL